ALCRLTSDIRHLISVLCLLSSVICKPGPHFVGYLFSLKKMILAADTRRQTQTFEPSDVLGSNK
ncbi:hypothetical protein D3OALGB2SA_1119, partial [Olavius algarvensis associated proteobacterium Delta 3]